MLLAYAAGDKDESTLNARKTSVEKKLRYSRSEDAWAVRCEKTRFIDAERSQKQIARGRRTRC